MNGQPLGTRKKFQILVLLTILVWATQTMVHQWGFGAEVPPGDLGPAASNVAVSVADDTPPTGAAGAAEEMGVGTNRAVEKFVPAPDRIKAGGTLELRTEANIYGNEVRLRQVCRWSESDAAVFQPVADLVLTRLGEDVRFKSVGLDEVKGTLRDAGANLADVRFAGPTRCTVRRADAKINEAAMTLEQWIAAKHGDEPAETTELAVSRPPPPPAPAAPRPPSAPGPVAAVSATPTAPVRPVPPRAGADAPAVQSLRALLLTDLAVRLSLPPDALQVSFNPKDDNLLNLAQPQFQFNLDARRVRNLGQVEWEVTVVADGATRKAPVIATARAWQDQVVVNKPLAYRQLLQGDDVTERRTLVDRLSDEPLLTLKQAVAQLAARDLKPGTVLTARMVDPVPLVKPGQLVTITTAQGNVRIKTVARSLEGGSFGQTIHVRNDATNDVYDVVLTGPQEGAIGPATAPAAPAAPADAARLAASRE